MEGKYFSHLETKTYQTKYRVHFITVTSDLEEIIKKSGIKRGTVTVNTHHTTAGLFINENEKNLIGPSEELGYEADLRKVLDKFASPLDSYGHNDVRDMTNTTGKRNTHLCEPDENGEIHECINGHSHAQGMILGSSLSLIVDDCKWLRGRWQELMLVELDHNRERKVSFLVQGVI